MSSKQQIALCKSVKISWVEQKWRIYDGKEIDFASEIQPTRLISFLEKYTDKVIKAISDSNRIIHLLDIDGWNSGWITIQNLSSCLIHY